jgi:hypothetical protein
MTVKASAGAALMLAAGLFVSFADPSPATAAGQDSATASKSESATSGKSVRHSPRDLNKSDAHRKHARASKSAESRTAVENDVSDAGGSAQPTIPEAVANANAQMISAKAALDSSKGSVAKAMSEAMSAKANTVLLAAADTPAPADAAVTAPDQLNDIDRALQETPATQTAIAQVKPAEEAAVLASNNGSSTLDKTSLIGKIFIGFGALLTMASAARMFMA